MGMPVNDFLSGVTAQAAGSIFFAPPPALSQTINLGRYTEDLAWDYHIAGGSAAKGGNIKLAAVGNQLIKLSDVVLSNPYGNISDNFSAAGLAPFIAGMKYLISLYVYSDADFWWSPRNCNNGKYGQGAIWCRGGYVSRVWYVATATSTIQIDAGMAPTSAPGAVGAAQNLSFIWQNANPNMTVWIGGLQIEPAPTSYLDGLVIIGDSSIQGSAGTNDIFYNFNDPSKREIATIIGSELRIPVFNRGIGGNKLSDMDTRWSTDVTPLKPRCNEVHIQGGINDISQGRTLAQMQASVQSMTAKALVDGFQRIRYYNCTPFSAAASDPTKEALRQQYNSWLASSYGPATCDIASVVTDSTGNSLCSAYGDGVHYPGPAKMAIAAKIISSLDFSWRKTPGAYVRVTT